MENMSNDEESLKHDKLLVEPSEEINNLLFEDESTDTNEYFSSDKVDVDGYQQHMIKVTKDEWNDMDDEWFSGNNDDIFIMKMNEAACQVLRWKKRKVTLYEVIDFCRNHEYLNVDLSRDERSFEDIFVPILIRLGYPPIERKKKTKLSE